MQRVLVLGAGQVGTFAARAIAERGVEVVAVDADPDHHYFGLYGPGGGGELVKGDILDISSLRAIMKSYEPDAIVLSAGLAGGASSYDALKLWKINVIGASVAAKAATSAGVRRLVFTSSFAVYGSPDVERISEEAPVQPMSEYGRTKAAAEQTLINFRQNGLDIRILRLCGIYGPPRPGMGSHSARFIESMLWSAVKARQVTIEASSTASDEYLYVKDAGRAIALATLDESDSLEFVFNVGSGQKTNAEDLRSILLHLIPNVRITLEITSPRHDRPMPPLDTSRIKRVLGFQPSYDLAEGFADYLQESYPEGL